MEEAAIQTTSLPWNLTLKGGRFFGEFGRLSYIHDHELPFVNRPLVLDRNIGGESKTDGVQVNYLLPISHYVSLTAGVGDQFGDTPNNVGDLPKRQRAELLEPRVHVFRPDARYFLRTGDFRACGTPRRSTGAAPCRSPTAAVHGTRAPTAGDRRRAAVQSAAEQSVPEPHLGHGTAGTATIATTSRHRTAPRPAAPSGPPASTPISRTSSIGSGRWDSCLTTSRKRRTSTTRPSRTRRIITWSLSHWNQLRLQYTHTAHNAVSGLRDDDAVYLQWAWIIGSHAHGWQER